MIHAGVAYYAKQGELEPLLETVPLVDSIVIDASGIKIEDFRRQIQAAYQRPHGQLRLVVIVSAELLSNQIQNSLLKVLEEPPSSTAIVLVTNLPNRLLPTIRSRLVRLQASSANQKNVTQMTDIIKRLLQTKKREEAQKLLEEYYTQESEALSGNELELRNEVQRFSTYVERKINHKLALDVLLLSTEKILGKELDTA